MHLTTHRWPIVLVAAITALIAGGGLCGCDDENPWEHPNRQRYPAPPTEGKESKSVAELEREWRLEDQMQAAEQAESAQGQTATQNTLQQATEYLQQAFEAALGTVNPPQGEATEDAAVGGGPPPEEPQVRNRESGDM
ncbi:hypothetical protein FIV42_06695 [Persicimonas caeni]|uniref:Uncharacterized protein n=1 Tax=Persicimonas caeni TaxID=2292766 RepID=A0A4Y6PQ09_PERCE|nr:hypothetical protein [Persicimonas caeni]QDG50431.1 hypothetical protein FIV42_06695 [Persicimonas caeni]QED31652.1 hypothetical protein FRD00_06690 [Persicimonas caeni]